MMSLGGGWWDGEHLRVGGDALWKENPIRFRLRLLVWGYGEKMIIGSGRTVKLAMSQNGSDHLRASLHLVGRDLIGRSLHSFDTEPNGYHDAIVRAYILIPNANVLKGYDVAQYASSQFRSTPPRVASLDKRPHQ